MIYYLFLSILIVALVQAALFVFKQIRNIWHNNKRQNAELQLLKEEFSRTGKTQPKKKDQIPSWEGWRKFRIDMVVQECSTIQSFYLVPHDGKPIPEFLPGQHLTFKLKIKGLSKPVIRCYSLSNSADQPTYYRVTIKKQYAPAHSPSAPDGVASGHFHENLERGDIIDVRAPGGKFYLDLTEKSPIVLIAGGIGLTPNLSMINSLVDAGSKRPIWLFYGVTNGSELIMEDHFNALEGSITNLKVVKIFSKPSDQDIDKASHDQTGHITAEMIQAQGAPMDADFYICGPGAMMQSLFADLKDQGIDQERIHFESFGPASVRRAPKHEQSPDTGGVQTFNIKFGLTGNNAEWNVQSGTLLEFAESNGAQIDSGCRAGSCGTCLTAILDGSVEYIDEPGLTVESGSCLPCIAMPKSNLVLNA